MIKNEELKAMDICCDAVIILGEISQASSLEKAGREIKIQLERLEILQIAKNLEVVPAHAPQTGQAIYWFTHLAVTTD